jgi:hypothetical protein
MSSAMSSRAPICAAIATSVLIEFDYKGEHRVVAPYCHGTSTRGGEVLRGAQLERPNSTSKSGNFGFGKLWFVSEMQNVRVTSERFAPDDPTYNPSDTAMKQIHCRVRWLRLIQGMR